MKLSITIAATWTNVPRNAERAFPMLSAIAGCRKCQMIEDANCTDRTIRATYDGSRETVFDNVQAVLVQHPDDEPMTLDFPPAAAPPEPIEAVPTVGVTESDCDAAVQVWEDEGRINPLMLSKRTGWPVTKCITAIAYAQSISKLPKDVKA